jgi:hypothetical protein
MKHYYDESEQLTDKRGLKISRKLSKQFDTLMKKELKAGYSAIELEYLINSAVSLSRFIAILERRCDSEEAKGNK